MKILVFSDIHGCFNSLKALVETQDWKRADKRIFLGDVCVCCSRFNECIEMLNQLDCIKIVGNNDLYVCDHVPEVDASELSSEKLLQIEYMQKHITKQNKNIVLSWQKDLELRINNKKFYFTHYPWETFNGDENVIDTPDDKTFESRKEMFLGKDADYYFFGHEHRENNFTNGKQHFYCVGTLGLTNPGYYLTIEIEGDKIAIEDKYVSFDINEEIELMDKLGYPYNKNKIKKN